MIRAAGQGARAASGRAALGEPGLRTEDARLGRGAPALANMVAAARELRRIGVSGPLPRSNHVIASEAKQSISPMQRDGLLGRCAPLRKRFAFARRQ